MRYLAIDYGDKRLGLALCDPGQTFVSPLCQLNLGNSGWETVRPELLRIVREHDIAAIVVGLPLNMDDTEGPQARISRQFADHLTQALGLPVYLQDERLSTAAANDLLADSGLSSGKRRQRRDMLAACQILQDFLDSQSADET